MSGDNHIAAASGEDAIADVAPESDPSATADDGAIIDSASADVAKALSSMLTSAMTDFDCRAESTVRSQDQLSLSIDRLTQELDQLLEDAPVPFLMQHAVRISGVRKRVSSLNLLLKSIQRRLDNVDRVLSMGLQHEEAASENAKPL